MGNHLLYVLHPRDRYNLFNGICIYMHAIFHLNYGEFGEVVLVLYFLCAPVEMAWLTGGGETDSGSCHFAH